MPFPFTLASIDLDDTLLGPDKLIGPANARAVNLLRDQGCRIILGSGRRHDGMLDFYRQLDLEDYVVSSQGALVKHSASGHVLQDIPIGSALAAELVEEGLQRKLNVILYTLDAIHIDPAPSSWVDAFREVAGRNVIKITDAPALRRARPQKVIWVGKPEKIEALLPQVADRYTDRAHVVITYPFLLEFAAHGADKATGIRAVADHYHIPREKILAFGDGDNDVPVLQYAGLSVAMSHANSSAKRAAHLVAADGDPESSFARTVQALLRAAGVPETDKK